MPERLSAVLPLKIFGLDYIENLARCDILFSSLRKYAAELLVEIFVVVTAREEEVIREKLSIWNDLPLSIINEDDLVPAFGRFGRVNGWLKQQIIKLSVADYVSTDYFLTLDADVILCKPMTATNIFVGGKSILEAEPRCSHPSWWVGSATMLGIPSDLQRPGMSVTPAILSRTVCRQLHHDLRARYRCDWTVALLNKPTLGWTEYTLYYLTAERHGLLDVYHVLPECGKTRLFCRSKVWLVEQWANWDAAACFGLEDPGLFTIVQNSTHVSPAEIRCRLVGRLSVPRDLHVNPRLWTRALTEDVIKRIICFLGSPRALASKLVRKFKRIFRSSFSILASHRAKS